jgi:hypothetical protein
MDELTFAFLATRPEFTQARSCRKKLVGAMRRYLRKYGGQDLQGPLPPHAAALIQDRAQAARALADICRRCGRCDDTKIFG